MKKIEPKIKAKTKTPAPTPAHKVTFKAKGKTKSGITIPEGVNIITPMTKAAFAKLCGISNPMITKGVKEGVIFQTPKKQIRLIDNVNYLMIRAKTDIEIMSEAQKEAMTNLLQEIKKIQPQGQGLTVYESGEPIPEGNPDFIELLQGAKVAALKGEIFTAQIKEEQAKQAEIKTAEMRRELAPISLVKYFFSFSEDIVQRNYRRVKEIEPELEALFLAGKKKEATKLLLKEQESIALEARKTLIKEIQEEGFIYKNEYKKSY